MTYHTCRPHLQQLTIDDIEPKEEIAQNEHNFLSLYCIEILFYTSAVDDFSKDE